MVMSRTRKFLAIVAFATIGLVSSADTMKWQVNPNDVVHLADGTTASLNLFLSLETWDPTDSNGDGQYSIFAARVNVCDVNGNILRTMETKIGNTVDDSWHSPVDIGHPNEVGATAYGANVNNTVANLSQYYQTAILLGTHNNNNTGWIFQEIAWSGLYSGELLQANGNYALSDDQDVIAALSAWIPEEFYTYKPVPVYDHVSVPEPTSGLLLLIGVGMIGLKRRKLQ